MRINGPGSIRPGGLDKAKGGAERKDGPRFSDLLKIDDDSRKQVAPVAQVTAVSALLAAQEDGSREEARKRQLQRGGDILDLLDHIRLGLLAGRISGERLDRLLEFVHSKRLPGNEPDLDALLDEIELRAMVELAKLGRDVP